MRHLIHNSIQTPDGTVLVSHHSYDYCIYTDNNGKQYMVDGGLAYRRRSANGDEIDLSLFTDAPHEDIRKVFTWGTRGREGDEPLKYKLLKYLTDEHITAILSTQTHLPQYVRQVFEDEQKYRGEHK